MTKKRTRIAQGKKRRVTVAARRSGALAAPVHKTAASSGGSLQAKNAPALNATMQKGVSKDLSRILNPAASQRWMSPTLATMTPVYIRMVLENALQGNHRYQHELFDLMEDTWPRLLKNEMELKQGIQNFKWPLFAWVEEDESPSASALEKKQLVSNALWTMRPQLGLPDNAFTATLADIADAWFKSTAVLEIVDWESRRAGRLGDILAPQATQWVHPRYWAFHTDGWVGLTLDGNSIERFPEEKFLVAICRQRSGHPLAGALLRPLAFWWCAANFAQSWLLNFAQIFGLPIRWANYDPNTPGLLDKVSDMLENMGSTAWAAFPAGTTLDIKEPMKTGSDNPQVTLLDRADKQCDLLIFGETTTSEVREQGGAYAASKVGLTKRDQIIFAAAKFVAEVLNQQFIPSILRMNYPDDSEAPEFRPAPETARDALADANRDSVLLSAGIEMPKKWFYQRHDIPLPQAGEEVIGGAAPVSPSPGGEGRGEGEFASPAGTPDGEDEAEVPPGQTAMRASDARPSLPPADTVNQSAELAAVVQDTLKPLLDRLATIAKIEDPQTQQGFLAKLLKDFPAIADAIRADNSVAKALSPVLADALVSGLGGKNATRAPALRAYSDDQPRVPGGSPEGGQWTDSDGYTVSVSGKKLNVKAPRGTQEQDLNEYQKVESVSPAMADAMRRGGIKPENYISVGGGKPIRKGAAPYIEQHLHRIRGEAAAEKEKFKQDFPGYEEIKKERAREESAHYNFRQAMERGSGILPAKYSGPLKDLESRHPKAMAYLHAESFSQSSNAGKSRAGSKAMGRLRAGEEHTKVIAEMEREWAEAAERSVWNS